MRVLCVTLGYRVCPNDGEPYLKENKVYVVKQTHKCYSPLVGRMVDAYEVEGLPGAYETSLFVPLSGVCELKLYKARKVK